MERPFVKENASELERLRSLVASLTDEQLLIRLQNGWPVYAALAHLAFWDKRSYVLMEKWKETEPSPSPIDMNVVNDALLPLFMALTPRDAARLAVSSAESIDKELETAPDKLITSIASLGDRFRLYRSDHRRLHLDQIETAVTGAMKQPKAS